MSSSVDQIFITKWIEEVFQEYQQKESKLRGSVRVYNGVGKDFKVPRMESVIAQSGKARQADVVPANVASDQVAITMEDIYASEYIDNFDMVKTNVDLRRTYTDNLSAAVNRKLDNIIITALDQTSNTELSISNTLNSAGLIAANKAMTLLDIPFEDRVALVSPGGQEDILSDNKMTSRDYVNQGLMNGGFVAGVLGFSIITHTGLPAGTGGSQTRNFFFHKNAVALGIASDMKMEANYIPHKLSWLVSVTMTAGAVIVRPEGVQRASIAD